MRLIASPVGGGGVVNTPSLIRRRVLRKLLFTEQFIYISCSSIVYYIYMCIIYLYSIVLNYIFRMPSACAYTLVSIHLNR